VPPRIPDAIERLQVQAAAEGEKASAQPVLYCLMNGDASARKKGIANGIATATTTLAVVRRMNVRSNIPASMVH
jgi:hypothetical protein